MNRVPVVMTIAGSDSGGGAGIQADLKSFQELDTFGTSVVTAITAQNTLGVTDVYPVSIENISAQLEAVISDLEPVAAKSGMLFSSEVVELVAETLSGSGIKYVCDPVMVAKGGAKLLVDSAIETIIDKLIPVCDLITPNIPEAELLSGMTIASPEEMVMAGKRIIELGARAVLMKGGHVEGHESEDILISSDGIYMLSTEYIDTANTHGTGCTYSAAITAGLGRGLSLLDAVIQGKAFVHQAIQYDLHLGSGHGPTNHHAFVNHGRRTDFVRVEKL